jgi:predicted amidohydrolase
MFGNVLGSEDDENRENIKRIWNAVLEHVAKQYEFVLFEEYTGDQIADQVRRLQAIKS